MNIEPLQLVYVLHAKAFRENSLICELLSDVNGRITAMVHKTKYSNPYQLFTRLQLDLKQGHGELYFVNKVEASDDGFPYVGSAFNSACYINELIVKLLKQTVDPSSVFYCYERALQGLRNNEDIEPTLRRFEHQLLNEMGVLPEFSYCGETGEPLQEGRFYQYQANIGFIDAYTTKKPRFLASVLSKIEQENWQDPSVLKQAKWLMRELIHVQLNGQVLKSRDLFKK